MLQWLPLPSEGSDPALPLVTPAFGLHPQTILNSFCFLKSPVFSLSPPRFYMQCSFFWEQSLLMAPFPWLAPPLSSSFSRKAPPATCSPGPLHLPSFSPTPYSPGAITLSHSMGGGGRLHVCFSMGTPASIPVHSMQEALKNIGVNGRVNEIGFQLSFL